MRTPRPHARVIAVVVLAMVSGAGAARLSSSATPTIPQTPSSARTSCGALVGNPTGRLASGTMSAQIDGVLWTAECVTVNVGAPGIIGFGGSDNSLSTRTTFGMGFGGSNTVGTYPVSNLALGINALLTVGNATWQSAGATRGAGTLTFTISSPSNVAGTFAFTLNPTTIVPIRGNTATGTKVVTNGVFNITF